uniref:Uncharacterized protein n=1 Tax=Sparus aurata TaxID=8175 RepID=A0A671XVK7_SPAAU
MLMVSEVSHYTGGTSRGERSGRGSIQKERGCQRHLPTHHEQSHWVRNCPNKTSPCTLPRDNNVM